MSAHESGEGRDEEGVVVADSPKPRDASGSPEMPGAVDGPANAPESAPSTAPKSAGAESQAEASATPLTAAHSFGARILRSLYWLSWFVAAPLAFASLVIWLLTPQVGAEHDGLVGLLEKWVREQPVPMGIGIFCLFESAFWIARNALPLASFAYPNPRPDLPSHLRGPVERAVALLEEADGIQQRYRKVIERELSFKEREKLKADLDGLRVALAARPFDEEGFVDALVKADGEVDVRLGPWRKSEVREYVESIIVAVTFALGLRAFVVEAFKIPSGSMIPTLQVGDHIFVNKFTYGPAIPFTQTRFWSRMPPARGDVMVFAFPEHPEQDFIKRVIALPGDILEVRNGHPFINGWEVPRCHAGVYSYNEYDSPIATHEGDLYVEYLGDAAYLTLFDRVTAGFPSEYQGPYKVNPGEVWVMGDNRNNSHDSRMWWGGQGGGVPFANIKGRAMFVWFSLPDTGFDGARLGTPVMGRPRLPEAMKGLMPAVDKCFKDRPPLAQTTPPAP